MIRKTSLMLTLILVVTLIGYAWGSPAKTINTDVVVVGAGGAGLTAAITAKEAGADVVVVEKMMIIGGNTLRATGGLNAAGTVYQDKAGIKDSPDVHYEDTMKGGRYENVPELVRTMVDNAAAAVEWLNDLGANLIQVNLSGGSTNARSHAPEGGGAVGPAVVMTLQNAAKERGIEVLTQTKAAEVLVEGGQVAGIRCETKDGELIVKAKAVVIATGGYGANPDMVVKYRPHPDSPDGGPGKRHHDHRSCAGSRCDPHQPGGQAVHRRAADQRCGLGGHPGPRRRVRFPGLRSGSPGEAESYRRLRQPGVAR